LARPHVRIRNGASKGDAPETTHADRQCVIRQLIERVTVHIDGRQVQPAGYHDATIDDRQLRDELPGRHRLGEASRHRAVVYQKL
jgi:hypothetical protein